MTSGNLTLEKIMEAKRRIDALGPNPFERAYDPFGLRPFAGLPMYEAPDPPPKLSLSREVAELVGPEFAAGVNLWLLARFGRQEDIFKDKFYMMAGLGIVSSKYNMALLRNIVT